MYIYYEYGRTLEKPYKTACNRTNVMYFLLSTTGSDTYFWKNYKLSIFFEMATVYLKYPLVRLVSPGRKIKKMKIFSETRDHLFTSFTATCLMIFSHDLKFDAMQT